MASAAGSYGAAGAACSASTSSARSGATSSLAGKIARGSSRLAAASSRPTSSAPSQRRSRSTTVAPNGSSPTPTVEPRGRAGSDGNEILAIRQPRREGAFGALPPGGHGRPVVVARLVPQPLDPRQRLLQHAAPILVRDAAHPGVDPVFQLPQQIA